MTGRGFLTALVFEKPVSYFWPLLIMSCLLLFDLTVHQLKKCSSLTLPCDASFPSFI